ncbi:MAG: FAD-dependent pyridine nucleotide-disulfide oxidoreductase [Pseudonocardiales bacterium]|nr:FAD-dependent pyridine nucleotide-disulfide oxidoreductase [Pseudonocardiales bacterium]
MTATGEPSRVVILGAGLELATRLLQRLAHDVRITLIDKNESFVFGSSKLNVMFGDTTLDAVRYRYSTVVNPRVEFRHEAVLSIDPVARTVVTAVCTYEADILVVALGAGLDPSATPGLVESGNEFYSPEGADLIRRVLDTFHERVVVIGALGPFFKCPPAPNEAALMLDEYLVARGRRDDVTIYLISPLPSPIPISTETSAAITAMLADRGIRYWPHSRISRLDGAAGTLHLDDGRILKFDLLLGIPVQLAPAVVVRAGLTAVGDITNASVPRAGSIAEGQAANLAEVLISEVTGAPLPPPYAGEATCYIETAEEGVARVDVNFLSGSQPTARFMLRMPRSQPSSGRPCLIARRAGSGHPPSDRRSRPPKGSRGRHCPTRLMLAADCRSNPSQPRRQS